MQNFLPCKTPTRGGHLDPNGMPRSGQLATTYEDPDAHMGHSPLVLGHPQFQHRNHHNLEVSVTEFSPRRSSSSSSSSHSNSHYPERPGFRFRIATILGLIRTMFRPPTFYIFCPLQIIIIIINRRMWRSRIALESVKVGRRRRNPVLYLFKLNYVHKERCKSERVCQNIEMQTVTTC